MCAQLIYLLYYVCVTMITYVHREIATLRAKARRCWSSSRTKASILHISSSQDCQIPSTVRLVAWSEVKKSKLYNFIGKGAFAKCFVFHGYCGGDTSLHIHAALHLPEAGGNLSCRNWEQILFGCISALCYLQKKNILHNDIKSDNILIEKMSPDFLIIRAVLVDFNKACHLNEALLYKLSTTEKIRYTRDHPQIAPEVRNGYQKQSFASDVYSMGRIKCGYFGCTTNSFHV